MFMIEIAGVKVLYTGDFSRIEDRHLMAAEVPTITPDVLITVSYKVMWGRGEEAIGVWRGEAIKSTRRVMVSTRRVMVSTRRVMVSTRRVMVGGAPV